MTRAVGPAPAARPAWYALARGSWRDYVTLLHPPYTAWHLSYVVIGGCLAPAGAWQRPAPVGAWERLGAAVAAFALAVGVGAHALDELRGRPLRTKIPDRVLAALAAGSLVGACTIGLVGAAAFQAWLGLLVPLGLFLVLVLAYNLELGWGACIRTAGSGPRGRLPRAVRRRGRRRGLCGAALARPAGALGVLDALRHGRLAARRGIQRYDGHTVHFTDGTREAFDAIIMATGFRTSFPFLSKRVAGWDTATTPPLYLKMMHPTIPSLFFIGLFQPLGCIWRLADHQARIAALQLSGRLQRPADIDARIRREAAHPRPRFDPSPGTRSRSTIMVSGAN
jgi:Flavin-binding monooxygenase-like